MLAIEPTMRYGTPSDSKKSAACCKSCHGFKSGTGTFGGSVTQATGGFAKNFGFSKLWVLRSDGGDGHHACRLPHRERFLQPLAWRHPPPTIDHDGLDRFYVQSLTRGGIC